MGTIPLVLSREFQLYVSPGTLLDEWLISLTSALVSLYWWRFGGGCDVRAWAEGAWAITWKLQKEPTNVRTTTVFLSRVAQKDERGGPEDNSSGLSSNNSDKGHEEVQLDPCLNPVWIRALNRFDAQKFWNLEERAYLASVDWYEHLLDRTDEVSPGLFKEAGDVILSFQEIGGEVDFAKPLFPPMPTRQ